MSRTELIIKPFSPKIGTTDEDVAITVLHDGNQRTRRVHILLILAHFVQWPMPVRLSSRSSPFDDPGC